MRIHSDVLSHDHLEDALRASGLSAEGVFIEDSIYHGSRKRSRAIEVKLGANAGRDRNGKARRPTNSGYYGSDSRDPVKGATYEEWGYWIAELYVIDSKAVIGPYDDERDFHRATKNAYQRVVA